MMKRRLWMALGLAFAAGWTGCAAPPGPDFTDLATPPTAYGHLYIYRPDIWFTHGVAVPVRTGTVRESDLYNATYLRIRLAPGWYVVDVNGATRRVAIVGGYNHFLEFDLSRSTEGIAAATSNQLANKLTERGELHLRAEADALKALRGLRRVGELPD